MPNTVNKEKKLISTRKTSYDMVHDCMVYTERAEMAAVPRGTSHVTIKQRC